MIANYLAGHPLAMLPTKVIEITDFLEKRGQGIKVQLDEPQGKDENEFSIDSNGIATIDIFGSISKRMNLLQKASGGVSVDILSNDIQAACNDDGVKGILLNIDSPGGSVHGIKDVSDIISCAEKPIVAYSSGLMASAAYWIASGADKIVVSDTSTVGSIGVVVVHMDTSKADDQAGVKKTVLTAGKFKALGNPTEPLSQEGREEIQDKLDQFYTIFVENVSKNRKKETDEILSVAEGRTFVGANAPKELVDLTGSIEVAYNMLVNLISEGEQMTIEEMIKTDEFKAEVEASANELYNSKVEAAVNEERERCFSIMSIEGQHLELKLNAIKEGSSVDSLYKGLYQAELKVKTDEQDRLANITEPASVNVQNPDTKKQANKVTGKDFTDLMDKYHSEGLSKGQAMMKARRENPSAHAAYISENN